MIRTTETSTPLPQSAVGLALVALCGCAGFAEPTTQDRATVAAMTQTAGPFVRQRLQVDVESPSLSGRFDGALVAATGAAPRVRVQLFHEMGTKAFDLLAQRDRIAGVLPQSGLADDQAPSSTAPPTVVRCLGITLLEMFARLDAERLRGARDAADGREFLVAPVVGEGTVTLVVDGRGALIERRFELSGGVRWRQSLGPAGSSTVEGGDVRVTLTPLSTSVATVVPESTFTLTVPSGMAPLRP